MNQITQAMKEAANEIRSLRRRNEILSAKVEVFDSLMCLLHTSPSVRQEGASMDMAWQLDKLAAEMEKQIQNAE